MSLADIWYETSPYLYALLGTVVLFGSEGTLAKLSGGLLVVAAITILRMRWTYRRQAPAIWMGEVRKASSDPFGNSETK